jgi:hypothetical protein
MRVAGSWETCDCGPDEGDGARGLPEYEVSVDAKHPTAETAEVPVTARVSAATETMVGAIDFDDEAQ